MKPIKYEDARSMVKSGALDEETFTKMYKAGLISKSPLDTAAERVPENYREEFTDILFEAGKLTSVMENDGVKLRIRVQVAEVKE